MVMALTQPVQTPLVAPAEVDLELFTFVERYATNLVRWDLLLFFGHNPEVRMTAAEIANQIRRNLKATIKELDDLAYLHVLTRRYTLNHATYQLARRSSVRRAVMRLAAYAGS